MSIPNVDTSVIDPSREEEELDVNAMKEEMYKLKQQMAEMYQAWAKGQPPSAYPANLTFTPPPAQSQDDPITDLSPSFPIYQHYRGTTSHTPQFPSPKPIPYPPPPTKLEKKHNESFKEYGFRWREQSARVDPPMKESEMVDYFLQALEPTYYGHLVSAMGKSFN
ncbi:transcription factor bHLH121-like [Nicotiana sylvestris]|uniref:transcription factor bHLH121-like n=1 Tax=Nicotiana sylvestris TaxID=4096 RepID=UPI00388CD592